MNDELARAGVSAAALVDVVYAVRLEPDMGFEYVSPSVEAMVGYTPQDHYDDPQLGMRLIDPRDLDALLGAMKAEIDEQVDITVRWIAKDGHVLWTQHRCVKRVREDESVVLYGAARDVTDQHVLAERYRLLAENASDIVTLVAPDGVLEWISPSVTRILGWSPDELVGSRPWGLVHADDQEAAAQSFAEAAVHERPPPPVQLRFKHADGSYVWLSASGSRTEQGQFLVSYRRVEDQVRAERALTESEERYRLLADNAQDLVFSLDTKAIIQWVSPSSITLLGYEPSELVGAFGGVLINPEDLPLLLDTATEAREGRPATCRIRLVTKAGADRWVQAIPRAIHDDDGALIGGVIGASDIHDEVLARQALQHEVDFDDLTGLAKRQVALVRIQEIIDSQSTHGWALLCVGVNGMTAANQAYTYSAGDAILHAVAERLIAAAGQADRVARIAGDEFAVLLRDVITPADAANAATRLIGAVRGPVPIQDGQVNVTACVGVAFWSGQPADELLRDAVAAMRQATTQGPDRWVFLDGDAGERARVEMAIQTSLAEDVSLGRVEPWLMPIVRLSDGKVMGFEALARWRHADGTVSDAGAFIEVAEHSGVIMRIDHAILDRVVEILGDLPDDQYVAVNVSAATLASDDFADTVATALTRARVAPRRLHLEVTETSLLRVTDRIRAAMERLASLGVVWWVDDFGTGFSSVSHLRDMPLGGLKLDMSFTRGLSRDDNHATRLARGLAGLATGIGLATVAEGVETAEQVQVLVDQGWQMGQGTLFGLAEPPAR